MTEPWLKGPLDGVPTLVAPLFYSFDQTRRELALHLEGLTTQQLWSRPHGLTAAGFHIRHIAGAAERLATYLRGEPLSEAQMAALETETEPGASPEDLLASLREVLSCVEAWVLEIDPAHLTEERFVGRKLLPTTVHGLIVHIAEHTQRHLGQAITTIKLVRAMNQLQ